MTDLKTDIVRESSSTAGVSLRRMPTVLVGFAVLLGLLVVPVGPGSAASAPVPLPGVTLPSELDWESEYHGSVLCSPEPKPGTLKLGALLDRTYGIFTKYYAGRACPNGYEHQEGRAIDWMVDSTKDEENAKAEAFIEWLMAEGPSGEPAENARRLGVMYLIWNNRIWAVYRQSEGWREYQGCGSKSRQSSGNDTTCHRDHIHISLTWDGANGQTSFWTGKAETRKPCPSSFTSRPNGSSVKKLTLLNTHTGIGLAAGRCRLTGNRNRTYTVKVPALNNSSGEPASQRIKIGRFKNNAPGALKISSAQAHTVPHDAELPVYLSVPLRRDGLIKFSLAGGHARVKVKGLGLGTEPPSLTAALNTSETWVNSEITAAGVVSSAPEGSRVVLQMKSGGEWTTRASGATVSGSYSLGARAPSQAGVFTYRTGVAKNGEVLATSASVSVTVKPAKIILRKIKLNRSATKTRIRGRVRGVPTGATLIVRRKLAGGKYRVVHTIPNPTTRFKSRLPVGAVGKYRFKVKLLDGSGSKVAKSSRRTIRIR